jgi:hypothetical protein
VAAENTQIQVNHAWRQGSVLSVQMASKLAVDSQVQPWGPADLAVIISQDCDILNRSLIHEPYIEVHFARARPIENKDGRYTDGRNPRTLQFFSTVSGILQLYSIDIHQKLRASRPILEAELPRYQLEDRFTDLIRRWTAKRYTRAALPDTFNERCKKARGRLERVLTASGHLFPGIYLRLDPADELSIGEIYRGIVRITAWPEVLANEETETAAAQAAAEIEAALNKCTGVELEVSLVSEEEFTLADLRLCKKWDPFDFISDSSDDSESILPPD